MEQQMKRLCLIHANCQGDPLAEILLAHPGFSGEYDIVTFTNYTREAAPQSIETCDLFLYQPLGDHWGDVASSVLLERIPNHCRSVRIPNLLFKLYWPFWKGDSHRQFKDILLDDLIERGMGDQEILHLYIKSDLSRLIDLDRLDEEYLEAARSRESEWDIPMLDTILQLHHDTQLFNTINHPNRELMLIMADRILERVGFGPCPQSVRDDFGDPNPEFQLPIHPQVAKRHNLSFIGEKQAFNVYGTAMTCKRYTYWYVQYQRLNPPVDYIDFMRMVANQTEEKL